MKPGNYFSISTADEQRSLADWLGWLETLHPTEIELGLERVREVYTRQQLNPIARKVIVVAGTNGKGSTIAMLETILLHAGYSVGSYTSPHLRYYNERVRIGGIDIDDMSLCRAFSRVNAARGDTSLTYFEFGTLAALDIFSRHRLDVVLLEVGLGGRLDAVNIVDADIAVITNIDIDHEEWLGGDREVIGREKAGIMRPGNPVICGDRDLPASIHALARETRAVPRVLGEDFDFARRGETWDWWSNDGLRLEGLPAPALGAVCQYDNAALSVAVLQALDDFPVDAVDIAEGLVSAYARGRFETGLDDPNIIYDVAHNPASAAALAKSLAGRAVDGATRCVFGAMADKDIAAMVAELGAVVDNWYLAAPAIARAAEPGELRQVLSGAGVAAAAISDYASVAEALAQARQDISPGDRLVVCGSFYTVAEAMAEQL